MARLTPEEIAEKKRLFLEQYRLNFGNAGETCKAVGIPRSTFYSWIEADEAFGKLYDQAQDDVIDNVESSLLLVGTGQKKGNPTALLGWLNARARKRGYGMNRMEHTGAGGGPMIFEVIDFAPGAPSKDPGQV